MKPTLSFFCPAYRDELNIEKVVTCAIGVLRESTSRFEILIIEDGSPDNTGKVADNVSKEYEEVKVIHHPRNLGYGMTLRTGISAAGDFDYICYTDGDNQYDVADITDKMLPLLPEYDAVISYRYKNANNLVRRIVSKVYNITIRGLFRANFRDFSSASKIFKKDVMKGLPLQCTGPFVAAEIVIRAHRLGFKIAEVGIQSYPRLKGRSSIMTPKNFLLIIREMLLLRRRL